MTDMRKDPMAGTATPSAGARTGAPAALRPGAATAARRLQQPAWLVQARAQATRRWQRLAPRERRLLSWGAAVGAIALTWVLAIEPAWQTVDRLGTSLPALRAQVAQVDAVLAEARTLQAAPGTALVGGDTLADITDSLRMAGIADQATVTAADADTWQVELQAAPIEPLMRWLQDLPFTQRLQPVTLDLARPVGDDGRPRAGLVSGSLSLARAGAEGA